MKHGTFAHNILRDLFQRYVDNYHRISLDRNFIYYHFIGYWLENQNKLCCRKYLRVSIFTLLETRQFYFSIIWFFQIATPCVSANDYVVKFQRYYLTNVLHECNSLAIRLEYFRKCILLYIFVIYDL